MMAALKDRVEFGKDTFSCVTDMFLVMRLGKRSVSRDRYPIELSKLVLFS